MMHIGSTSKLMCYRNHISTKTKQGKCAECVRINASNWRKSNSKKHNEYQRKYRVMNLSKIKKMLMDKEEIYFTTAYRKKKRVIDATPKWADHSEIRRMYEECVRLSEQMNVPFEVDHHIPIHGRKVCGLHVPENLKVVSNSLNKIKANKFNTGAASDELLKWLKDRGL